MASRSPICPYECQLCGAKCKAAIDSLLGMLCACAGCQEKRHAKGLAKQREADGAPPSRPPALTFEQVWGANG